MGGSWPIHSRTEALKGIVEDSEQDTDPEKSKALTEAAAVAVEVMGRQRFFQLRDDWSWWIIFWISTLIGFNIILTALVGFGVLNFQNYQWFITAVTVETFLQIVGMGYVAVKYLFSDGDPK